MGTESDVICRRNGPKASITFNKPEVHNALSVAMYERLESILDELGRAGSDVRVLTLSGSGDKAFVAGTDITHFLDFSTPDDGLRYEADIERVVGKLENLTCVTIAQLHGVCAGGGAALALACDFRYADDHLRFGVPIARTLGNCLATGNVARLIDHLGVGKTKEVLLQAHMMDAAECLAQGLVNAVVPAPELQATVDRVVERILGLAPLTIRASKLGIQRVLEARRNATPPDDDLIRSCYTSADFHSAVRAFLNKSTHEWQGN